MLEVRALNKQYRLDGKVTKAVNNVSFKLMENRVYALIGESGSGKSTLSQLLMGLLPPTSGEVLLDGVNLTALKGKTARERFSRMQMVLQDGLSSLDPRLKIYDSIAEPIRNLKPMPNIMEREYILDLLKQVELSADLLDRKPGELSGGQQKRVCIARALSVSPEILIFDEAISGLDVIVRKSILQLLKSLQSEKGFTSLFITHDMEVALYLADEILVMKDGCIVEKVEYRGDTGVFQHPYSRILLSSMMTG